MKTIKTKITWAINNLFLAYFWAIALLVAFAIMFHAMQFINLGADWLIAFYLGLFS